MAEFSIPNLGHRVANLMNKKHHTQLVSLKRGSFTTTDIEAVRSNYNEELRSEYVTNATLRVSDWIFEVADYSIDNNETRPVRGDLITTASGEEYRIMASGNEPEWSWHDTGNTSIRVRTQQIK